MIFDFMIEIDAPAITLAPREPPARIGAPAEQPVEIRQAARHRNVCANPARGRRMSSPSVRTPMAGEPLRSPPRASAARERQRLEPRGQRSRIGDEATRTGARRHERGQRRGRERETRLQPPLREHRIRETGRAQLPAQLPQTAEQADARLDLEQQSIGRFDGHLRRERGGDARQPLHERQLARGIARPGIDVRRGRERRAERHADAHARRGCPRVRVDDARIARFVEHHERRGLHAPAR